MGGHGQVPKGNRVAGGNVNKSVHDLLSASALWWNLFVADAFVVPLVKFLAAQETLAALPGRWLVRQQHVANAAGALLHCLLV